MSILYRAESLPALFGFEDDKDNLSHSESIRHAAVNKRDYSGVRHGVLCKLALDDARNPHVTVSHWSHLADGSNHMRDEIEVRFKRERVDGEAFYKIAYLKIFDQTYIDLSDPSIGDNKDISKNIPSAIKAVFDTITKDNNIPDIPTILEDYGVKLSRKSRRTMHGIRRGGMPFLKKASNGNDQNPNDNKIYYRRTFIPAMTGVEPHANDQNPGPVERHDVVTDPKTGKQYDVYYSYKRDLKAPGSMDVECFIRKGHEKDVTKLYSIKTKQKKDDEQFTYVEHLNFLGQDVDLNNEEVLTRALESIRLHNRAIRNRHYSLGEGELMTEILHETGLVPYLFKRQDAPSLEEGGRFRGRVLGGVNDSEGAVSTKESSIGGNSYAASFDYTNETGEEKSYSIIIDDGIGFLDWEKDGFDYWKASLDPYLKHKSDPADHTLETETLALVYTHKHKDHFFWEPGYVAPVLIMEPLTYKQFVDDVKQMRELSKQEQQELIAQCHVVDPKNDINPDNPSKRITRNYNGTIVEQWTEVFDDPDKPGGKDYAPRLRLYKEGEEGSAMELRLNYVSHSVPCMMVDVVTPAKTVGLTGDFKFTKDVYVGKPTSKAWISAIERDFLLMETTGADREEKTPNYDVLEDNYTEFFYSRASQGRRLILPIMPNDVQTLYAVVNAMKRARAKLLEENPDSTTMSHFTADGKTLEDMVRYLNDGQGLFKKYLAQEERDPKTGEVIKAPVTLLTRSSKTIKELANTQSADLMIAVTGTQVEDMAVMTRAGSGELDRWEIGPKDTILNTKKAIPVGNNIFKRRAQKDRIESNFGAEYVLPEEYEKEHSVILSVSGHGGAEDLRMMIEAANAKYIGVTHGTSDRFDKVEKMIEGAGGKSLRLSHQEERGGGKGDGFDFLGQVDEHRQYARQVYPRPFFWRTRWNDHAVVKMLPVIHGSLGDLISNTENAALNNKKKAQDYRRHHVATNDNMRDSTQDIALELPAVGVRKSENQEKGFLERNDIGMIASCDTEGTGLVEEKARLSQFALHARDSETRKEIIQSEIKMQTPDHVIWSLFAALKTNSHPKDFKDGDTPRVFSHKMMDALQALKWHPKKDEATKTLLLGYNFHRHDSQLITKEFGLSGQRDLFTHRSSGLYLFDVRQLARMIYGYGKGLLNVQEKEGRGGRTFLDFSLEGLCEANNIPYPRTHKAIDDTYPAYDLFAFIEAQLKEVGRLDILEQAMVNCDTHSDSIAKDIVGANLRPGTPKPVFSYISPRADRPHPRLGVVVGTEINATSGRALIVFNLNYDPDKYLDLSQKELLEMAQDYNNDVFDVLYLDKHPIIAPMDFAFSALAQKQKIKFSKETYIARARLISRNLTRSIEQNAVGKNKRTKQKKVEPFETRVLNAFGKALSGLFKSRSTKDKLYSNIDRKIYRIPRLKSEWGLIKRSSEDMKKYHIAPNEDEIIHGKDLKMVAHMAVLLGQLNNGALVTLTEENLYDLWQDLSEEEQLKVSRIISTELRAHHDFTAEERRGIKQKILGNVSIALDNVRGRRAQTMHAPAAASHISLKKARMQYEQIMKDQDLYDAYIEDDPKKKAILDAWPAYLDSRDQDQTLSLRKSQDQEKPFMRRLKPK